MSYLFWNILVFIIVASLIIILSTTSYEQRGGMDVISYSVPPGVKTCGCNNSEYVLSLDDDAKRQERIANGLPPDLDDESDVVEAVFKDPTLELAKPSDENTDKKDDLDDEDDDEKIDPDEIKRTIKQAVDQAVKLAFDQAVSQMKGVQDDVLKNAKDRAKKEERELLEQQKRFQDRNIAKLRAEQEEQAKVLEEQQEMLRRQQERQKEWQFRPEMSVNIKGLENEARKRAKELAKKKAEKLEKKRAVKLAKEQAKEMAKQQAKVFAEQLVKRQKPLVKFEGEMTVPSKKPKSPPAPPPMRPPPSPEVLGPTVMEEQDEITFSAPTALTLKGISKPKPKPEPKPKPKPKPRPPKMASPLTLPAQVKFVDRRKTNFLKRLTDDLTALGNTLEEATENLGHLSSQVNQQRVPLQQQQLQPGAIIPLKPVVPMTGQNYGYIVPSGTS